MTLIFVKGVIYMMLHISDRVLGCQEQPLLERYVVMCRKVGPLNSGRRYISSFTFNLLSQRYLKSKCNEFGLI